MSLQVIYMKMSWRYLENVLLRQDNSKMSSRYLENVLSRQDNSKTILRCLMPAGDLLGLISDFSIYYFKTGTMCLLSLSSHVFTALEFDSNHFGNLLWKIVKPRDHNEIKSLIRRIFWNYKTIKHYFAMCQK